MTHPAPNLDVAALRARLARMEQLVLTQTALAEAELDLDAFMAAVVERLAGLIGANGSIVELVEGEDMVYRAANAPFAHYVGTRLKRATSLSGLCVEKAEVILCDETRTDPRVDGQACERIGIRSMVCAPLFHDDRPIGALKVFSAQPAAFDADDIDALRLIAAMLGAHMSRQTEFDRHEALLVERTQALAQAAREVEQRERLEVTLRANEERLSNIISHAHQAIVTIDDQGEITGWNGHAEMIFGWQRSEVMGRQMADIIVPEALRAAHTTGMRRYLDTEQAVVVGQRIEVTALRRGGETFPIELAISATRGADGWNFTALMHDISERRAQVELFENAFNHAPIGMALVDLDGGLVKLNEIYCEVIGYSAEEAAVLTFQEITHPDDLTADLELLQQLLTGEIQHYQLEKRYIRKDGATIWVRLSVSLVHAADGSPKHFIAQIQDLSAERHAEHRYQLMAENATDIIVTSDLLGRTTFLSPASEAVTGYTADDMMGRSPLEMIHDDDAAEVRRTFGDLLTGKAVSRVRWRARHKKTGEWIWLESQPALLRDPATDAPTGFLDVIRDITAQKTQEDALAQARLDAEAATRSKADFLANMSHELRTPLNSIIGFTRLLTESRSLDAEDQRRVGLVHSAGQALHAVIDNVLDFSKLEAAALELHCAPFDLGALVTQTVSMMEPQAAAKDVRLRALIDAAAPTRVVGDLGRLRQVLLNLLSNAVKFTAGGSVTVNLMHIDRDPVRPRIRLEVVDTGAGIALEKQAELFSRFVQAASSISAHYGGTGLGLAISKQLINLMGGEIGVISAPGRGSTFWFELALPVSDADAVISGETETQALSLAGKRLLVVDDVELNRELMLALLGKYGCEVRVAHDGAEAVATLAREAFDLVLMDCQMPVMDGFMATRTIRASDAVYRDMPIIALTASGQPEHLARCEAAGMNGHLTKPLDAGALERTLTLHLGGAKAWRALATPLDDEEQARQDLVATLGAGAVLSLMGILRGQFRACQGWSQAGDDAIRQDAHALAGASGMMGFMRLSAACRALEATIEEGRDCREAIGSIRDLMDQAMIVAARWETDLTARVARQHVA
jgi:PAS domain S-box-containing protein